MPRVSIVVPVFHNAESLPDLFAAFAKVAAGPEFEFVFVDDGSRDDSWTVLDEQARRDPRTTAIKLSRNFGSFVACVAGLSHARGDAAILISADLQDPPELIPAMVALWNQGHEVVLAVRERRM